LTISIHKKHSDADNPFPHGWIVSDRNFAGREAELAAGLALVKEGKNVLVRAEKGMGKTSFLAELTRKSSKDFELIYIDGFGVTTHTQLLQMMTRELIDTFRSKDGPLEPGGWELLKSTRLKLAVLQGEYLSPTAKDEILTLMPPSKKELEGSDEDKKKNIEIKMCPDCSKPLKWIEKYSRYYCYSCKKYLSKQRKVRTTTEGPATRMDGQCPGCGGNTSFVEKYSDYYCDSCGRYLLVQLRKRPVEEFTHSDMMEVFDLPQKVANQKGTQVVVIFDEFQEILSLESKALTKTMRSRFETHTDANYVFAGSNCEVIHSMFEEKDGTFYKFAEILDLGPIVAEDMEKFLMERFRAGGGKLVRNHARRIVALSGGYPGHAQRIAHELFHLSKEPNVEELDNAIRSVIAQQSHEFMSMWETIRSPLQRRYLVASVAEPRASHGADFIERHDLKSRSHVQRVEKQLEAKGIIKNGEVKDPLFVLWLRSIAGLA